MKERIIFHIDVNNAFLSWTAVLLLNNGFNKDIRKIASVIGGDEKTRRGIVLAKSPVAKKYGIVTAETLYSARKKYNHLQIFPPNYTFYYTKSKELMEYLSKYSPVQEQLSIDECFLDMSGMNYIYDDLIELAHHIKDEIKTKFGYTVNIGIANNKLCAKMASDFEKPDKVHTLFSNEIENKLWPLDVKDLYMCGKATVKELYKLNIKTIGDLAKCDESFLEKHFKSYGKYLYRASRGIDNSKVEKHDSKNPSISISETLPHNYSDKNRIKEIIFRQVEELSRELRSKNMYAKTIGVTFKNSNFIRYSAQETLENATDNTKLLLEHAYHIIDNNYKEDEIRLIGVKFSNLLNNRNEQLSIFENKESNEQAHDIQKTIDDINNKFGKSVIKPAVLQIIGEHRGKKQLNDKQNNDKL